jgi:molybdenum cofactor cytidylyltransferase
VGPSVAPEPRVAALLLAAGRGTRFGPAPKLLAEIDGEPLVRRAARAALASRAGPLLVVLGHAEEGVRSALEGLAFEAVPNPDYALGLSTSLRAGFRALPAEAEAAVVLLGDMPGVGAGLIDRLVAAYAAARPAAVVPVMGGRRANPVLLDRRLAEGIAGLAGDRGAAPLLAAREDVLELAVDDPGALLDVDTPDALAGLGAR